jgi:hypothetical protein
MKLGQLAIYRPIAMKFGTQRCESKKRKRGIVPPFSNMAVAAILIINEML